MILFLLLFQRLTCLKDGMLLYNILYLEWFPPVYRIIGQDQSFSLLLWFQKLFYLKGGMLLYEILCLGIVPPLPLPALWRRGVRNAPLPQPAPPTQHHLAVLEEQQRLRTNACSGWLKNSRESRQQQYWRSNTQEHCCSWEATEAFRASCFTLFKLEKN